MVNGILVLGAVLCVAIFVFVLFFQRGQEGVDLSPRSLMRLYLYVASLAGVILVAIGLSALLTYALATAYGNDFAYGRASFDACPGCPTPAEQQRVDGLRREQSRLEDLPRGITFTLFGAALWGAHRLGRRFAAGPDEAASVLGRGYHIVGTGIFGLTAIVAIPTGVYQVLSSVLLAAPPEVSRGAAGEPLAGGLVALPFWLGYLRSAVLDFRNRDERPRTPSPSSRTRLSPRRGHPRSLGG